jgi:outer membrane protein assembly factor BamB
MPNPLRIFLGLSLPAILAVTDGNAARLAIEPDAGPPTTVVQVVGAGFGPGEGVTLLFDASHAGSAETDATGGFTAPLSIPALARPGTHVLEAIGQVSGASGHASFLARTNWSQFLFEPGHSGFNPYENVLDPRSVRRLERKWTAKAGTGGLGGGIHSQLVVVDGVVYANSEDGNLYALDASDGTLLWTGPTVYGGDSTPAVADGLVVAGTNGGGLLAFPASCTTPCQPVWTADTQTAVNPAVVLADGVVYASAYSGYLDAFDAATGSPLWSGQVNKHDPVFGPSAVANGKVYAPGDLGLYVFPADCTTPCEPLWVFHTPFGLEKSPSIVDGVAYFVADQGTVYAIDAETGMKRWLGKVYAIPTSTAVANGKVYASAADGKMRAFSTSCGGTHCHPVWTTHTPGSSLFDPVVANGVVYAGSLDFYYLFGSLFAFPEDCTSPCHPIWSYPVEGAIEHPPTVADGVVYVGTILGNVYAFGLP